MSETQIIESGFQSQVAASSNVQLFIDQYVSVSRKTALAIIELASVVYSASVELAPKYYAEFKDKVHFDNNSSSFVKLEKIGAKAELLKQHADKLPNAWTTIYHIASLTNDVFETLVDKNQIWPGMTGAEAIALKNPGKNKPESTTQKTTNVFQLPAQPTIAVDSKDLRISFSVAPKSHELQKLYNSVSQLVAESTMEANVHVSPSLEAILFASDEAEAA